MSEPSPTTPSTPAQAPNPPKGTRDFYPIEMARRRWIEDKWRKVAIRHGFEEIDGPTFEETELYTRKSGDGIVGEIFGVYSGKDEASVKAMGARLAAGERGAIAPFALRPEFTPTLARMYAARARQLPQPCKWFWQGPCYRAERPQRGRLREFWQWNCDVIGGEMDSPDLATLDVDVLAVCIDLLSSCGLTPETVKVHMNDRVLVALLMSASGVQSENMPKALALLDRQTKMPPDRFQADAASIGLDLRAFEGLSRSLVDAMSGGTTVETALLAVAETFGGGEAIMLASAFHLRTLSEIRLAGLADWVIGDFSVVRGLAYYTGMVFEVIVDGERAVAGGGRYDNLIETFGGPPTPAVGFGMGDVVLSLVLQDKGLMPTDAQIARDLGLRPDVFVISNGTPESDAQVGPLLADLRRRGMHARRSYKSTKNIGKLLKEASDAGSRYAVIIESTSEVTLKNLDDNTQDKGPREEMVGRIRPA